MRAITDVFIQRPVLATAINILLLIAGCYALFSLPLRLNPEVNSPVISITTLYPGAAGKIVEQTITTPLENALSGIDGIDYISSNSQSGLSNILIHLRLGQPAEHPFALVMAQLSTMESRLPTAAEKPVLALSMANTTPTMVLAVTSKQIARRDLVAFLQDTLKHRLEMLPGVSRAQVLGRRRAMRITLDPLALQAYAITPQDLKLAIRAANVTPTAGNITAARTQFMIQANSDVHTAEVFGNIVIARRNDNIIRLNDVARVAVADRDDNISAYYNGQAATMILIQLLPGANPIMVTTAVRSELKSLSPQLPYDLSIHTVVDAGRYISAAINEVALTLLITVIVVIIIMSLFLSNWQLLLIPIITIPISLIGAASVIALFGFSINTLSLLAMVLAIGLVVDDAIVVVENIVRNFESGKSYQAAAFHGAREVISPVITMTITLAAVYTPIALVGGLTGQLFREFALTLAVIVIFSGIIAITLAPMLASRALRSGLHTHYLQDKITACLQRCQYYYLKWLCWVLRHQVSALCCWGGIIISCVILCILLPKELAPAEDQGYFMAISTAPNPSNQHYLQASLQGLERKITAFPEHHDHVSIAGIPSTHQAISYINLLDWQQRAVTAQQLIPRLQNSLNTLPGLQTVVSNPPSLPGSSGLPLQLVLQTSNSYLDLATIAAELQAAAERSGMFAFIQTDLHFDAPVLALNIDRAKACAFDVSMQSISNSMQVFLTRARLQQFIMAGHSYDVFTELQQPDRANPADLLSLPIANNKYHLLSLDSIADYHISVTPNNYNHFQKITCRDYKW